jgi:hypothetical protein
MLDHLRLELIFSLIVSAAPHHSPEALAEVEAMLGGRRDDGVALVMDTAREAITLGQRGRAWTLLERLDERIRDA